MKRLITLFISVCFSLLYAQTKCNLGNGKKITFPGEALCTYQFEIDTTDALIVNTHIKITPDSLFYADILTFKNRVTSLMLVSVAIKDLKRDLFHTITELDLNQTQKGYLLSLRTSVGHNSFLTEQESDKYGFYEVGTTVLNIICCEKAIADTIVMELNKRLDLIK